MTPEQLVDEPIDKVSTLGKDVGILGDAYDAANQLENIVRSDGSFTTFAHDNNGNLIGENRYDNQGILAENRSYSYDFNARLVKVKVGQKSIFEEVLPPTFDPSIFRAQ